MWLNKEKTTRLAIVNYQKTLAQSCLKHVIIDGLFNELNLDKVVKALQTSNIWQTQKHTYSALYVDDDQWSRTSEEQRFVKRDVLSRDAFRIGQKKHQENKLALEFLEFLRGDEFMSLLSNMFNVQLTDKNVENPEVNTNFFRLAEDDLVEQHADDSPGREVCMLLYLNKDWEHNSGGELVFSGIDASHPVEIAPLYNRCVLFDPSSKGSEHWVKQLKQADANNYRYNVTSWYWRE